MFTLKSVKLNHPVFPPFPPHPQSFLWSDPYCYPLLLKVLRNNKIRQIKDIKNKYLNSKFDLHLHPDLSGKTQEWLCMWDRIDSMSECLVSRSELLSTDVYIQALATFLWFVLFLTKRGQGKLKNVCTHCLGNVLAVKQNVLKWRPNHSQNVIWREIASFVPHWKWNFAFLVGQKIFPYQYTVFRFYQANKKKCHIHFKGPTHVSFTLCFVCWSTV